MSTVGFVWRVKELICQMTWRKYVLYFHLFHIPIQKYSLLLKVITRYIKASIKKDDATISAGDPKPNKTKQVYTIRDVIIQNHRDLVDREIPHDPKGKQYIGGYQRAVTTVVDNMSPADRKEAEELAEKWSKAGAPQDKQLK